MNFSFSITMTLLLFLLLHYFLLGVGFDSVDDDVHAVEVVAVVDVGYVTVDAGFVIVDFALAHYLLLNIK